MLSRAFDHIRMEKAHYKFLIIIIIRGERLVMSRKGDARPLLPAFLCARNRDVWVREAERVYREKYMRERHKRGDA